MTALRDEDVSTTLSKFSARIVVQDWPDVVDLNAKLRETIMQRRTEDAGILASNSGGWHSTKNLTMWKNESIDQLLAMIHDLVSRHAGETFPALNPGVQIEGWANVNEQGHSNDLHHHQRNGNLLSGVYYVALGTTSADGPAADLFFHDPHAYYPLGKVAEERGLRINMKEGRMLLFPSGLPHRVEAHLGSALRVSIAFNVKHPDYTNPAHEVYERLMGRQASAARKTTSAPGPGARTLA